MDADGTGTTGRRRLVFGVAAVLGVVGGAGLAWRNFAAPDIPSVAGDAQAALWGLRLDTPGGQPLALQSLRGKPLLLNFWATWCPPCIEEMPILDGFFKSNAANGWQVLGIAIDQKKPVVEFLSRFPVSYPIVLGGVDGVELTRTLGNRGGGLPFSVVIGSQASILVRKMGRITTEDLRSWAELR